MIFFKKSFFFLSAVIGWNELDKKIQKWEILNTLKKVF